MQSYKLTSQKKKKKEACESTEKGNSLQACESYRT